jgi:uncharacterized cupredoxin-like copper-binding protein
MFNKRLRVRHGFVPAVFLAVSACTGAPAESAGPSAVQITIADYSIVTDRSTVRAGEVTLNTNNTGKTLHEIEVFSLPDGVDAARIPVAGDLALPDSVGMEVIDEIEPILPGTSPSLTLDLPPGRYAFLCNLPTHYELGMHAVVTVQ